MIHDCKCREWARTNHPLLTDHHPSCPRYEKKMIKVWTVYPGKGMNSCVERDVDSVIEWIKGMEPGESIKIVFGEIEEAAFNEIHEYIGP